MRKTFENHIYNIMGKNEKIIAITADSGSGKFADIKREFSQRYLEFGIAECNMVAASAAIAKEGFIPVIYAMNNFLVYRAYEFIRNDVCLQNRNVKFVGLGAGVVANTLGPTHHTTEDIAALRVLPNLTILSPGSPKEVPVILDKAIEYEGPVYIRLGKAFEREIYEDNSPFEIGKANFITKGKDLTIVSTGSIIADALEAVHNLEKDGFTVDLINMSTIKPFDKATIISSAKKTGKVLTVEEHSTIGGLGGAVTEALLTEGVFVKFDMIGFNDTFCKDYGWHQDLKKMYGMSPNHIYEKCKEMCVK